MAVIRELELRVPEKYTRHTDAEGTYSIIYESDGKKLLQIDTYGSKSRRIPGKVRGANKGACLRAIALIGPRRSSATGSVSGATRAGSARWDGLSRLSGNAIKDRDCVARMKFKRLPRLC